MCRYKGVKTKYVYVSRSEIVKFLEFICHAVHEVRYAYNILFTFFQ